MKQCFLCGRNGATDPLDKHHCLPGKNRQKADKLGLYVYLCHSRCHLYGEYAAHRNKETALMLKQWAQKKAMKENNLTTEDFIREFGRNYLEE